MSNELQTMNTKKGRAKMDKKRNSSDTDSTTDTATKKFQVGGQAVIEGVMMRSPKLFTVAVR
ncbi:unnamed protein product, partial [marine sediment metagenome]